MAEATAAVTARADIRDLTEGIAGDMLSPAVRIVRAAQIKRALPGIRLHGNNLLLYSW
jgi:hypothetical protein